MSRALDAVLAIGQQLSNIAYNLGQGQSVHDPNALSRLAREWDVATRALRKASEGAGLGGGELAGLRVDVIKSVQAAFARAGVTPRKRKR